jgi:hypothetical protein
MSVSEARNAKRKAMIEYLRKYKEESGCTDCKAMGLKSDHPHFILQFDHLPGYEKKHLLANVSRSRSWKVLHEEVSKTEVVCANHHCERTWNRAQQSGTKERAIEDI